MENIIKILILLFLVFIIFMVLWGFALGINFIVISNDMESAKKYPVVTADIIAKDSGEILFFYTRPIIKLRIENTNEIAQAFVLDKLDNILITKNKIIFHYSKELDRIYYLPETSSAGGLFLGISFIVCPILLILIFVYIKFKNR